MTSLVNISVAWGELTSPVALATNIPSPRRQEQQSHQQQQQRARTDHTAQPATNPTDTHTHGYPQQPAADVRTPS